MVQTGLSSLPPASRVDLPFAATSPAQLRSRPVIDESAIKSGLPGPTTQQASPAAGPQVPETSLVLQQDTTSESLLLGSEASAPGDFVTFKNNRLGTIGGLINEPSLANKDNIVFYTGNRYLARSMDGGQTWYYQDPAFDMSDFCCDQDVLYNPSWSIFLWYRQGFHDTNGVNRFRLGASADGTTWFFYDIQPNQVDGSWTNQWFDYPNLAYGNDYLYITSNIFANIDGIDQFSDGDLFDDFARSVVLRWPLYYLKYGYGATYNYYSTSDVFTFAPVQGATTTMVWASHVVTGTVGIYSWPESTGIIQINDVGIPAYSETSRGSAHCPSPDGGDICARTDDRILGGWVANGILGFFWNVREDAIAGFPFPYVYIVRIVENTKALVDTPIIWNSNYGWVYGFISPNARGHLGLAIFCSGATSGVCRYPTLNIGVSDDLSQQPWEVYVAEESTHGPGQDLWGDYIRVRAYSSNGNIWAASGYTLQGGPLGVQPNYLVFGRYRDNLFSSLSERWLGQSTTLDEVAWKPDRSYALIVGNGKVLRYDGHDFTPLYDKLGYNPYDVKWRPDGSYALIVGSSGRITKYDGASFTQVVSPTASDLNKLDWKSDGSLALIVGASGTILRYDGTNFFQISSYTSLNLNSVSWDTVSGTAIIVGEGGMVINYDPITDSTSWLGQNITLEEVAWKPDGSYGLVVGRGNIVLKYDGTNSQSSTPIWDTRLTPPTGNLTAPWR